MVYDLIIIGSGIAGSSLLYLANKQNNLRIALIDKSLIGGEISRFGGAANIVFGDGENLQLNISGEECFQEIYKKKAPISKMTSNIYTEKNFNSFPFAIKKKMHLEQPAYIGNPSQIAHWLCSESYQNTDFYICTRVDNINSKTNEVLLSTGKTLRYKAVVLAIGNSPPKIDGKYPQIINSYKKLCVLNIKSPFLSKNRLHFFADEDAYCFPDKLTNQTIFCYPTNTYIDNLNFKPSLILKKNDLDLGLEFIKKIKLLEESKIYGGRIFYEGYTENREPKVESLEGKSNIFLLTAFSGSGLRLSFGAAKKILTLLRN